MFRVSKQWRIDPEQIRTFGVAKREELNSWSLDKRPIFVNDMAHTFGEFYSFDTIEEWHQLVEGHPSVNFSC